ncbi:Hypothetical protein, putative [Bodo saltans]|uniref:Uncharacterized protein n=1 Tax=Bodo saltans TaxID=75058 RepID=A0A0S4JFR7_BODSA|nr:Hypothetical protein, putative [Bodo saltans]|eukprot:CUG90410.1 Hypothetical protein, putative [Bodo saltans]
MNIAPPPPQADGHQHTDDAPLVHVMMEQQHLSPAMLRVAAATTFDGLPTNAALHPISCPPGTTMAILEQLGLAVTAAINVVVDQHNGSGGKPCRHNNVIHPPPPLAASSASAAAAGSGAAIRERYSAMMMAPHEPTSHHFEHHHQEQQERQEHHEHHSPLRSGLAAIRTMHDDHLRELDDHSSPQPPQAQHQHAPRHRQFLVDCLGEHEPPQSCATTSSPTPSTPTKVSGANEFVASHNLAHRSLLPPIATSAATHPPPENRSTTLSPPPPLTAVDETHPQKHYSLLPRLASMSLPSKQQVGPVIAALDRDEVDHLLLEIVDLIATYRQRSSVVVMSHSNETPLTSQIRPQSTSTKHRRVKKKKLDIHQH